MMFILTLGVSDLLAFRSSWFTTMAKTIVIEDISSFNP